jgi:hypothetical protein
MSSEPVVVTSRRTRLLVQGILITAAGVLLGLLLQSMSVIQSSALGRLSDALRLPLIEIVVPAVAASIAVALLRNS